MKKIILSFSLLFLFACSSKYVEVYLPLFIKPIYSKSYFYFLGCGGFEKIDLTDEIKFFQRKAEANGVEIEKLDLELDCQKPLEEVAKENLPKPSVVCKFFLQSSYSLPQTRFYERAKYYYSLKARCLFYLPEEQLIINRERKFVSRAYLETKFFTLYFEEVIDFCPFVGCLVFERRRLQR